MAIVPEMSGKKVAVMGLGKSGLSAARALAESGAEVWAWDDSEAARTKAAGEGIAIVELARADLSGLAFVAWSPGIPHTHPTPHPAAIRAKEAGVPLLCDVELLARAAPKARFVAVTGTNGKSTTTALIAHIFETAGYDVALGGNIGTPALDLPILGPAGIYVLELSSYQLELLDAARFDAAVLLNITPDHLGRHGGMEGYVAAKASLFSRLKAEGVAVIAVDDDASRAILDELPVVARRLAVPVSARRRVPAGVYAPDGVVIDEGNGRPEAIVDLAFVPALPGRHNWQNAAAAYAATRALGVDGNAIRAGIASFPGLAHRQERIGVVDGVLFVNDSKATNADAAAKALACYDDVYWIAGGRPKEGGINGMDEFHPRIRKAFLIGEAEADFAATLAGKVELERCATLDVAVARAFDAAKADGKPKPVVLLSPAAASWDQFNDFGHRGDVFRALVAELAQRRRQP